MLFKCASIKMTEYSWMISKGMGQWNLAQQHLAPSHLEILQACCHASDQLPRTQTLRISPFCRHIGQGAWVHFGAQISMWGMRNDFWQSHRTPALAVKPEISIGGYNRVSP